MLAAIGATTTRLQAAQRPIKLSELRGQTALSSEIFDCVMNALFREQKAQLRDEMVSTYTDGTSASNGR